MTASGGLKIEGGWAASRFMRSNISAWWAAIMRPRRAGGIAMRSSPRGILLGALITILALAVVTVVADAWAIVQARSLPRWLIDIFSFITDFGKSGWILWPLGIALALLALISSPRLGWMGERVVAALAVRFTFIFVAVGLPGLLVSIVKRLIGRARPFVGGAVDPYRYEPFAWSAAYASLPSGHATTAFAAAMAIGTVWPQARLAMWTYALLIGVSRVVVSAHHPSDVVAGAMVGTFGALLIRNWFAARRLGLAATLDGRPYAMPNPSWRRVRGVAARLFGPS
jgi:undecaprenyl-diphosphatase